MTTPVPDVYQAAAQALSEHSRLTVARVTADDPGFRAVVDVAYRAGRKAEGGRIAERLWVEADAATDEGKRALLNEAGLIAHDLDTYAKVYPIGLGRPGNDVTP